MPWDRPVVTRLLTAMMLASVGGLLFLSSQWVRIRSASGSGRPSLAGNDAAPARRTPADRGDGQGATCDARQRLS
jgi:hypothetical protein